MSVPSISERVAELIAEADPLTPQQIEACARVVVAARADAEQALKPVADRRRRVA